MEKSTYRDMLGSLSEKYSALLSKKEAAELLGVSVRTVSRMINKHELSEVHGKITIGSLARLLC